MHRTLWGFVIAVLSQLAFVCWHLWSPLGAGPAYALIELVQYGGVFTAAIATLLLARGVQRESAGHRANRAAATAAMGLGAASALFVLAAMVCLAAGSPVELVLYGLGLTLTEFTWLVLAVLGLTALSTRPRPVLPAVLLLALFLAGISTEIPLPYRVAGPAGEPDTSYLIRAEGGELHHGRIYGLTVWSGSATVADYLCSLVNPNTVVVPESATAAMAQEEATLDLMLADSEEMAKAVGLQLAGRGRGATPSGAGAVITRVASDSPAADLLQPGDLITGFNGTPVPTWAQLLERMKEIGPGVQVSFTVRRDGQQQEVTLTTVPNPSNPEKGRVGIQGGDQFQYDIPVPITTSISADVGGPSLGLALTLQVVDQFTPGGITNGWRVAATGQMLPDGKVGAVGSVRYKVRGAERAGAGVLFVPRENYEEALFATPRIQVVPVDTAQDALAWLKAHPH